MSYKIFITGTDTNVGKTIVSVSLLKSFNELRKKTIGIKPIASGCFFKDGKLYNEDALYLYEASSLKLNYGDINPFAFKEPIAPHLAAQKINKILTIKNTLEKLNRALSTPADCHIIEGAGGWLVPLNKNETMAELVKVAKWPVIVVIPIRLGCLNHALLTIRSIEAMQVPMIGWVANCVDPLQEEIPALIDTLTEWLPYPCLGKISYQKIDEKFLDMTLIKNRLLMLD